MNMSVVNNYQAVAGIKPPTTASVATSQQNPNQTAVTNQKDTATISTEGQSLLKSDHKLKTDPIEIFMEWKNKGGTGAEIAFAEKPIEKLLPENQKLIAQLRAQEKHMSADERLLTEKSRIPTIRQYGDQEIFTSAADADKRGKVQSQACSLEMAYLTKTGHAPVFHNTMTDILKPLGTGHVNNTIPQRVQDLQNMIKNNPVSKFDDPNFLADYLKIAYPPDYYQQPATTKSPWEK